MQPSAQGIASMFMGNPGALAARVDKDRKQSPMGIPDDLRQLMALNIVTTENDAAKRQQALSELQQMAPSGQPPTVADSVRQQAAKKLQARMVQEQQKQQAMQQMMSGLPAAGIPQGVPQPERQPQGIDEAPVEFGMAGGGIVSFNGEKGSRVPKSAEDVFTQMDREKAEKLVQLRQQLEQVNPMLTAAARSGDPQAIQQYSRQVQEIRNQIEAIRESAGNRMAGIEALINPPVSAPSKPSTPTMPAGQFNRMPGTEQLGLPTTPVPAPALPPMTTLSEARASTKAGPQALVAPPPSPAPIAKDLLDAARMKRKPAPPVVQQQPAAPQPEPKQEESRDPRLTPQGLSNMASAGQLQTEADYERRVGAPSTAALDKLMAELERQKAVTEGPKAGFGRLAEYLSQIAATPRGLSSLEAGAAGARGVQALEKERAAQRAALTEKQIGLEQQKLNAARDYAKEKYGVGKAAFDRAYKNNLDIFKEQGLDYRQAELFAQQKTLKDIDFANQKELEKIRARNQAAMRPFDVMGEYAKALLAGDTKRAEALLKAIEARRPGTDLAKVKDFQKSNEALFNRLRRLNDMAQRNPEYAAQATTLRAQLIAAAQSRDIDPNDIPDLVGSAGANKVDSSLLSKADQIVGGKP